MTRILVIVPGLVLFAIALVTPGDALAVHGDVEVYFRVSLAVLQGGLPYRDMALEYPPASLVPMLVPRLLVPDAALDVVAYRLLLAAWNACLASVGAWLLVLLLRRLRPGGDPGSSLVTYAGLIGLGSAILPWRFDLFPIVLVAAGIVLVLAQRPAWAGFALGLAIAAKLYPAVPLGVVALWLLAADDRRDAARLVGVAVITVTLVVAPFAVADPAEALRPLAYQGGRGLEIESVGAGVVGTIAGFRLTTAEWVNVFGGIHLESPLTPVVLLGSLLLTITLFALFVISVWERFRHDLRPGGRHANPHVAAGGLVTACLVSVALLLLTSKILSAQFVWWLLPFGALLRGWRLVLLALVMALTVAIYPGTFLDLVDQAPWAVALLDARNILMALLAVVLWLDLRPRGSRVSRGLRVGLAANATALTVVTLLIVRSVAPVPVPAIPRCRPSAAQVGLGPPGAGASVAVRSEPGDCRPR